MATPIRTGSGCEPRLFCDKVGNHFPPSTTTDSLHEDLDRSVTRIDGHPSEITGSSCRDPGLNFKKLDSPTRKYLGNNAYSLQSPSPIIHVAWIYHSYGDPSHRCSKFTRYSHRNSIPPLKPTGCSGHGIAIITFFFFFSKLRVVKYSLGLFFWSILQTVATSFFEVHCDAWRASRYMMTALSFFP